MCSPETLLKSLFVTTLKVDQFTAVAFMIMNLKNFFLIVAFNFKSKFSFVNMRMNGSSYERKTVVHHELRCLHLFASGVTKSVFGPCSLVLRSVPGYQGINVPADSF